MSPTVNSMSVDLWRPPFRTRPSHTTDQDKGDAAGQHTEPHTEQGIKRDRREKLTLNCAAGPPYLRAQKPRQTFLWSLLSAICWRGCTGHLPRWEAEEEACDTATSSASWSQRTDVRKSAEDCCKAGVTICIRQGVRVNYWDVSLRGRVHLSQHILWQRFRALRRQTAGLRPGVLGPCAVTEDE